LAVGSFSWLTYTTKHSKRLVFGQHR
jgi:hypothetical protein